MKLGIFKLVGKDCGNLAIGLGNSSVLDLVTLKRWQVVECRPKMILLKAIKQGRENVFQ